MTENSPAGKRIEQLIAAIEASRRAVILTHNDPDPDAIASAYAMQRLLAQRLGKNVPAVYRGLIGRAENKALIQYLGNPMRRIVENDFDPPVSVLVIDTQPGADNNALPPRLVPAVVIDHHSWREPTGSAAFYQVSPEIGACATILTEIIQEAGLEIDATLATALFYGIKTDTRALSRGTSTNDVKAYFFLQPLIDVAALAKIEQAQVPFAYFKSLAKTLDSVRMYHGVVIAYAGQTNYPDIAAEMADLLLRVEKARWVICMNIYKDTLYISVRTNSARGGAGHLAAVLAGEEGTSGGHGTMAGAQIPLKGREAQRLIGEVSLRGLTYLKIPAGVMGETLV